MRYFKTFTTSILVVSLVGLFFSCNQNKPEEAVDDTDIESMDESAGSETISAQKIFNQVPGRNEIVKLTTESQAQYNAETLNNPDNVNSYLTESSKALNLGVYGADLNVTGVFEQSQESLLFLKCVNILAKSLGISNSFDEKMANRMEANRENRDSTLEIISQSFKSADKFLKANGRPGTSTLIVVGSWIEGIYCACKTAQETNSETVVKEIYAQEKSLADLIQLCQTSSLNDDAKYIIDDLKSLEEIFNKKIDFNFKLETLKDLNDKVVEIRTKITAIK